MQFTPVTQSYSSLHWFDAQETFIEIINVENGCPA